MKYGVGNWSEKRGNHRAILHVDEAATVVWAHIPWRRRDLQPELKDTIVINSQTGERVMNTSQMCILREFGIIVFEAETAGTYEVYYLPNKRTGDWWFQFTEYSPPANTARPGWLAKLRNGAWRFNTSQAKVVEIQARSEFDRFDPMEVIATFEETCKLTLAHPNEPYLLFPEDREFPIRMTDDLPLQWIEKGPSSSFKGTACRNEYYVFQIGLYALQEIEDIKFRFDGDDVLFTCFNTEGVDWLGKPFDKVVNVPKGKVQALWCGVQVPREATSVTGTITLSAKGLPDKTVQLNLSVSSELLEDCGDSELWKHSRLRWLNSTIGLDDEVVEPFTPMNVIGQSVGCLGRQVHLADTGLPSQIVSHFASTPDHIVPESREILASPMKLLVETADGVLDWVSDKPVITQPAPGVVTWESHSQAGSLGLFCSAKMEMDGYLIYRLILKAERETVVQDIRLEIPYVDDVAKFMVGMKHKGGLRPDKWQWEWDENSPAHQYWVGNTNAGLYCKLKHSFDAWDLHNLKDSGFPSGWFNEGKGGCFFETDTTGAYSSCAYTGQRILKAGEELELRFSLLVTPVKPLDYARFDQRYYHWAEDIVSVDECLSSGATVINIHHGNLLNPNINYPFNHTDKLKAYVDEAHAKGAKVKVYYTVRELTNWVKEVWALKSLNNEIYTDGIRGGHSWLYEHFVDGYQRAWHMYLPDGLWDAAILTNGLSRWHNYYLEGLSWLIKNVGIDGIYLDGIGYDREIMKRVRKVMDQAKPGCLIDFHSGDPFQEQYGWLNATAVYAEHFPYVNTLWFGEGFLPTYPLDFWMVEMSGIPFGLFGEMLQYGGNLHRGMLFGMPNRMYQETDASHIWKFWDLFGIRNSKMYGYWDSACPVKTNHSDVPCTVYQKEGKALICLASWAEDKVEVKLTIDWQALGLDESNSTLTAYPITNLQDAATFKTDSPIPIEPQRGWLLILEKS